MIPLRRYYQLEIICSEALRGIVPKPEELKQTPGWNQTASSWHSLLLHQIELFSVVMVCSTLEGDCALLGLPVSLSVHPGTSPPVVPGCFILVKSICYPFLSRGGFLSLCHFSHSSGNIYQATEFKCQLDFCSHFQDKKIYKENRRTSNISSWRIMIWRAISLVLSPAAT